MPSLKGARIALLEARMSEELSELVRRFGGVPYAVPSVREVRRLEEVPPFLDALVAGRFAVVVCQTGVGVLTLLREAERLGRLEETLAALRIATTVCRGPKPSAALKRYNVPVRVSAAEPYTTTELLDALDGVAFAGKGVALLHYGELNHPLSEALKARGAVLTELCSYKWELPEDVGPLKTLVGEVIAGQVDAVAFTSQVQWRHLFQVAADLGRSEQLVEAMNCDTIVAAIGPVVAAALRAQGITPDVLPAHPKMGPLIVALADYFELSAD